MIISYKLTSHPYATCHFEVDTESHITTFYSYDTSIAAWNSDELIIDLGFYSRTTSRHISWMFQERFPQLIRDYKRAKSRSKGGMYIACLKP